MSYRFRKFGTIAVALFFLVSAADRAPDQLAAGEFSVADAYYRQVVMTVLHEGYAEDVRLRMLATSVLGEDLVGFRIRGQEFQVFVLRPKIALSSYVTLRDLKKGDIMPPKSLPLDTADYIKELEASLPRDYRDVPVEKCVAPLNERIARRLLAVWERALRNINPSPPPDERVVLDGGDFHFWVKGEKELAGHVYAPDSKWRSHQLAGIGSELYKFCKSPTAAGAKELERLADELQ